MLPHSLETFPPPPPGKTGWPWTSTSKPLAPTMPGRKPWPKISIVTPSYNQGQFLEETIRSVLLQNYPNLEYIIMDGGSTDNSVEIVKKYEPWLTYWVSEKDGGQVSAINAGFDRSSGELMSWLNSDDILLPKSLYFVAKSAGRHLRTTLAVGERLNLDAQGHPINRQTLTAFPITRFQVLYMGRWPFFQESTFFSRYLWGVAGPLSEQYQLLFDLDFFLRCLRHVWAKPLAGRVLGAWRHHDAQKVRSERQEELDREVSTIYALNRNQMVPDLILRILWSLGRRTVWRNDRTVSIDSVSSGTNNLESYRA